MIPNTCRNCGCDPSKAPQRQQTATGWVCVDAGACARRLHGDPSLRASEYCSDAVVVRLALEAAKNALHIARNAAGMGERQGLALQKILMEVIAEAASNEILIGQLSDQMLRDYERFGR